MRKIHRMVRFFPFLVFLISCTATTLSAQVVSGPMLGIIELRDAKIWAELSPAVSKAAIRINKKGEKTYHAMYFSQR